MIDSLKKFKVYDVVIHPCLYGDHGHGDAAIKRIGGAWLAYKWGDWCLTVSYRDADSGLPSCTGAKKQQHILVLVKN
jgi:hypothetical protein